MASDLSFIAAIVVVVALSVGGWAYGLKAHTQAVATQIELDSTKSQLDLERRLRAADQAAVASVNKKLTALKAQKGKTDAQLKAALVAEPDWANRPVPDGVRAALRVRHATND